MTAKTSSNANVEGVSVQWKDLSVFVNPPSAPSKTRDKHETFGLTKKRLLMNVSGEARPGRLMAVMGASGSGKSTLLTTLAGRVSNRCDQNGTSQSGGSSTRSSTEYEMCGSVRFIGEIESSTTPADKAEAIESDERKPLLSRPWKSSKSTKSYNTANIQDLSMSTSSEFSQHSVGFVYQDDLFVNSLTVEEHLNFVVALKLPRLSRSQRHQLVERTLRQVGLKSVRHIRIGNGTGGNGSGKCKGISGGERKRLSFASAIVHGPSVLFCDEPTTGLDSTSAVNIVKIMKSLCLRSTVICTIHQPNTEIFNMFDDLYILAEGGRSVYNGPLAHVVDFFNDCGFKCPTDFNPADFVISTTVVEPFRELESRRRIHVLCERQRRLDEEKADGNVFKDKGQSRGLASRLKLKTDWLSGLNTPFGSKSIKNNNNNEIAIKSPSSPVHQFNFKHNGPSAYNNEQECLQANEVSPLNSPPYNQVEDQASGSADSEPINTDNSGDLTTGTGSSSLLSYHPMSMMADLIMDANTSSATPTLYTKSSSSICCSPCFDSFSIWFNSFTILLQRSLLDSVRNKSVHTTRFFNKVLIGILTALIFSSIDLSVPNQTSIQSFSGLIFIWLCETCFSVLYGSLRQFPSELPLSRREVSEHMYSPSSYYFAKLLAYLPGFILDTIVVTVIYYYGTPVHTLQGFPGFVITCVIGIICTFVSSAFGIMFSLLFKQSANASTTVAIGTTALAATSGFYMALASIPVWLRWFRYLNWFAFAYEYLMVYHWLSVEQMSQCPRTTTTTVSTTCMKSGSEVIFSLGIDSASLTYGIPSLIALCLFYNVVNFALFKMRVRSFQ